MSFYGRLFALIYDPFLALGERAAGLSISRVYQIRDGRR
jgi:hypothetical protein